MHPSPNILRSSVCWMRAKTQQSKNGVIKELFYEIGLVVFLLKKGHNYMILHAVKIKDMENLKKI